ncbi:MFS transporter, partial [Saccharothrix sp. MB29]|nr:MFS transporter [Saccharothrix sp. MB29]
MGRWHARFGPITPIWLSALVTFPLGLLVPLGAPDWRLALVVLGEVGIGYGVIVYNVAQLSYRQSICPTPRTGCSRSSGRAG